MPNKIKKTYRQQKITSESGAALLIAVIFFLIISVTIVVGSVETVVGSRKIAQNLIKSKSSYFTSEAGIEDALYRVKKNKQISNPEAMTLNDGTVSVIVNDSGGGEKEIIARGDVSSDIRNIKTSVSAGQGYDFFYGVQVGAGGMEMDENSNVIGSVYSNGSISGSSGSKISGDAIVAGHIEESLLARSIVCNQDQIVGKNDPQIDFAQSFVAPSSEPLAKVSLYLKKIGNPDSRTVKIAADNNGSPDNDSLASGTLNKSLVATLYGWTDITFSSPPLLTDGNTYWIILDADKDNDEYWIWCKDSNNGYGNGVGKYSKKWNDDPWAQITGDLNFRTYFGAGVSLIDGVVITGDAKANTITDSKICGNAYYQSIDSSSLNFLNGPTTQTCGTPVTNGMAYPGASDSPLQNMPISQANIDQWKADAQAGGTVSGNYNVTDNVSLGPKEIIGDLIMSSEGKTLTITGTIYAHGNIDISNNSAIRCASSYGANSCLIVADGWIHTANNGTFVGSGASGSFIMLLTTLACDGSFSSGCTHHEGAVDVHNNATGVIFYAQNGKINLHNGVNVTEITAYKLKLDNTATVTYDQGLVNANFSSGPSGGWNIKSWKEVE